MARAISEWPILVGLVILLIGCTDTARTPSAPTLPAGLATGQPGATATPTSSRRVTATEQLAALPTAQDSRFTMYGFRAESSITFNAFTAVEFPVGREISTRAMDQTSQGAFFSLAPDAEHAYVLAGSPSEWQLVDLLVPTMQVVKRTPLKDAVNALGMGHGWTVSTHGLAVSTDGREVYGETARTIRTHPETV